MRYRRLSSSRTLLSTVLPVARGMFRVWKQFSSAVSSAAKAGRPMAAMAVVTALTFRKLRREIFLENITKFPPFLHCTI